ncbi:hypothetical protein CupriaWKF_05245 [Cupriavidus sp. WKF15]|uniref:hypothetical protein n=1 Tax=Cupriavidus sp. WKF15 TaxID=3032282 RepID=UPI0023E1D770|nr:hypothetical protein [Cupriavidus sp. WKF15]WER46982.1 hypothetical protein CupriaWKF_05245 [Cupriavidus sp. WKF15]
MSSITAVPCLLCGDLARRWRDRRDQLHGDCVYRCARCGGRFSVTGDASSAIGKGQWNTAELMDAVRQHIAMGALPRIENIGGMPSVRPVGRQTP